MSGSDFVLSFREVIPDQTNAPTSQRKDITINTGMASNREASYVLRLCSFAGQ